MRFLQRILLIIIIPIGLLGGFLLLTHAAVGAPNSTQQTNTHPAFDTEKQASTPILRGPRLISIPFGFNGPLPVLNSGEEVLASGGGGCTAGEQVTINITVTQSISDTIMATGIWSGTCTGEEQPWRKIVTTTPGNSLTDGPAEACGLATTRDNGEFTDDFEWCADLNLVTVAPRSYLPLVME